MKRTFEEFNADREKIRNDFTLSYSERQERDGAEFLSWIDELEVGDHAHVCLWTDVEPVTVIKRTPKSITVRYDKATLSPDWKPEFVIGGFAGHCTNQDTQEWIIEEDKNGSTGVFRRRKNGWYDASDCRLYPGWRKFYDYNF